MDVCIILHVCTYKYNHIIDQIHKQSLLQLGKQNTEGFFSGRVELENFIRKKMIFFIALLKTLSVGKRYNRLDEAVLTSTHNLCFGSNMRKKNCILMSGG